MKRTLILLLPLILLCLCSTALAAPGTVRTLSAEYTGSAYTAYAEANILDSSQAVINVTMNFLKTRDLVTGYQVYANNLRLGEATVIESRDETAGFQIYCVIPERASVLGLCPIRADGSLAPEETITLILREAKENTPDQVTEDFSFATVYNPDPNDRLHLRKRPYGSSDSLGKYYNGTRAQVLDGYDPDAEWTHVSVYGLEGYMMTQYLVFGSAGYQVPSACPKVTVMNPAGTGLNLRMAPSLDGEVLKLVPNGMEAEVLGLSQDWLHVIADEQIGFIKANGVSPRLAYTYGVPGGKPMKARITQYCSVYSKPILPGDDVGDAGDPNGLILSTAGIGECTVYQIKNGYARIDPSRQMWVSLEVLEWIEE